MKRQRIVPELREQGKPKKYQLNELEITNLHEKDSRPMTVKTTQDLENKLEAKPINYKKQRTKKKKI